MRGKIQQFSSLSHTLEGHNLRYPQRLAMVLAGQAAPRGKTEGELLTLRSGCTPPVVALSPLDSPQKAVKELFFRQFGVPLPTLTRLTRYQLSLADFPHPVASMLVFYAPVMPLAGGELLELNAMPLPELLHLPWCTDLARFLESGLPVHERSMILSAEQSPWLHRSREVA